MPQCQNSGTFGTVEDRLQFRNYWTIMQTTETMDKAIVQAQSRQSALHAYQAPACQQPYHVGAMSIRQYSGHIVPGTTTDESRSGPSWHIVMMLPEVRQAVGHLGPGTAS